MLMSMSTPECRTQQLAVAEQVFATVADLEITQCDEAPAMDSPMFVKLEYSVGCNAAMLLMCSSPLAYLFTSRFMAVPLPLSFDADVADALGELVNMIGGNLKGLMPPETVLSTPALVSRDEMDRLVSTSRRVSQISFCVASEPCSVSLYATGEGLSLVQ